MSKPPTRVGKIGAAPPLPLSKKEPFSSKVHHDTSEVFDINIFELGAISLAFFTFVDEWRGNEVIVHTDSSSSRTVIKISSLHSDAKAVLRRNPSSASKFDIEVIPKWIAGKDNLLADAISRFSDREIANLCPQWQIS